MMIALSIFMFPIKFEKHARNEWHTLITRLNAIENRNALIHLSLLSIFFLWKNVSLECGMVLRSFEWNSPNGSLRVIWTNLEFIPIPLDNKFEDNALMPHTYPISYNLSLSITTQCKLWLFNVTITITVSVMSSAILVFISTFELNVKSYVMYIL